MTAEHPSDFRADPADRDLPDDEPARGGAGGWLLLLVALVAAGAGWWWWSRSVPAPAVDTAPVAASSAPAAATEPTGPRYPVEPVPDTGPLASTDVADALAALIGKDAVSRMLITDGFAQRFAATVDNLGREHAPVVAWPVRPTAGRFTVSGGAIAADNANRYTPFVLLADSIDARAAVQLYRRLYPLLQQAYTELGFGKRYFNDRVVEVIDLLLATPEPASPPAVTLTEVRGPVPSERPWVRYEFADARLQSLTAGQKMLLRTGLANERRLKAKLAELRRELVTPAGAAAPASSAR